MYVMLFAAATAPGLPIGWALFGRRHAAGWIAGGLLGYVLTAVTFWTAVRLGADSTPTLAAAWAGLSLVSAGALRLREPLVRLPAWTRNDAAALSFVLLLVPVIVGPPFLKIGAKGPDGQRQYRAYFTADFLWHVALTDELTKLKFPPANPYAADYTLNYYWTYFLVPAVMTRVVDGQDPAPRADATEIAPGLDVETILRLNALCAGLLFVGMVFLFAWSVVPRAGPAALAVCLALVAASAEGAYLLWNLHSTGRPLSAFRMMNVDAMTLWDFSGLTVDGLPRSLWYTPQHAMSCALGLIALTAAGAGGPGSLAAGALAGLALGGAVTISPFLGGAFALIYGLAVTANAVIQRRSILRTVALHSAAAFLTTVAIGWCVLNQMLLGAGGALQFGFRGNARNAPATTMALALGPLLLPSLLGLWQLRRVPARAMPAVVAVGVGAGLFYLVSIGGTDPIWVGWRAGQILLITLPGLAAACFAATIQARGWPRAAGTVLFLAVLTLGLPTTLLDAYNAQDTSNHSNGPGFPWTVSITPAQHEAFEWIRRETPRDAVVQMEPTVRGRATWTHIPTFARRRMAAGLPISLVAMPYYETRSQRVRELYGTEDARRAWEIAHDLRVNYLYMDAVERSAYRAALEKFDRASEYFRPVFRNEEIAIYAVGNQ